jgi:hypothetical protein
MLEFLRRRRASRDLDLAMRVFLLGWTDLEALLRTKYATEWRGFVDDVAKGAKPYDTAMAVIYILIVDTLGNHLDPSQARQVGEAISSKRFENRPAVFDLIAQVAYHAYLMEKDGSATAGLVNAFLNDIAKWFSEEAAHQEAIRNYLIESTIRFRSESLEIYRSQTNSCPN